MNRNHLIILIFILTAGFIGLGLTFGQDLWAEVEKPKDSVSVLVEKLDDTQVRELLINELRKEAEENVQNIAATGSLSRELEGPGFPLARLLNRIEKEAGDSADRFRKLWRGLPALFPSLYSVFVTL